MKIRRTTRWIAQVSALFVLLLAQNSGAAQSYMFTDLGTLGGSNSSAAAINNVGQIVGWADTSGNSALRATLWNGTTTTDLGTLGDGEYSGATAINNSGQIVGYSRIATSNSELHATLWSGTTATDLGTLNGTNSYAFGINNSGQVAGYYVGFGAGTYHAALWNGAAATDLGTLGGNGSFAYGINNSGLVVGRSNIADGVTQHAVLWGATTITDLGTQGGTYGVNNPYQSVATAINNDGQIAGYARISTSTDNYYAAIWSGATFTVLGGLDGSSWSSFANALNNVGQVVGYTYIGDGNTMSGSTHKHAVLWNGNTATDLNSFLDASSVSAGWVLTQANGINDNGWIVGDAINTLTGETHAFQLAAVPEPETYAMMLAGLAFVGFTTRRRRAGLFDRVT